MSFKSNIGLFYMIVTEVEFDWLNRKKFKLQNKASRCYRSSSAKLSTFKNLAPDVKMWAFCKQYPWERWTFLCIWVSWSHPLFTYQDEPLSLDVRIISHTTGLYWPIKQTRLLKHNRNLKDSQLTATTGNKQTKVLRTTYYIVASFLCTS